MDDKDFDRRFKGRQASFLDKLPHVSDGVLVAFRIGEDEMDIRVFFFSAAHEKGRDLIGKMAFSDTVWSV